jgi:hypothetical protein
MTQGAAQITTTLTLEQMLEAIRYVHSLPSNAKIIFKDQDGKDLKLERAQVQYEWKG